MDVHSALLFYCDPKISHKIAGLKSADGHELIQENPDAFIVWEADAQRQKSLQKILTVIDPETKMQMCATFDQEHNDFVLHLGGTDFGNLYDLRTAATAAFGGVSPRSAVGGFYTESAIKVFTDLCTQS